MSRKYWLMLVAVMAALALLSLPAGAAGPLQLTATPISAPPEWVNFYGVNSTLNGAPLPAGAEVIAYAGAKRCGSFVVHTPGQYGLLPCFREQSSQPGALPGDSIRFTINGFDAITRGPDEPIWTNQGDRKNVELEASGVIGGPTATRTVMPTSTSAAPPTPTATIMLPATPTPTVITPVSTATLPAMPFPTATATIWWPPLPTATVWWPYTPQPANFCRELLQDGGFEAGAGWTSDASPRPAIRSTAQVHSGYYSMRLGIDSEPNTGSVSAVRQRIQIPSDATSAALLFYYYPTSEPYPSSDYWQVLLMEPGTNSTAGTLFQNGAGNERRWISMSLDLMPYRGRTVDLYFSMYNDGSGGRSALYLDDVSLQVCVAGPPTWTPVPTAWVPTSTPYVPPTPWPTTVGNCQEVVPNGGFEAGAQSWLLGATKAVPGIVADPRHSGNAAMRLGIVNATSVNAFSSVRQTVAIPSDAVSADLTYWVYLMSLETVAGGKDHQELVYLGPGNNSTIAIPWRTFHENSRAWTQMRRDLLPYRGQSLDIYFNVYNDGINGDSAMILDDVSLRICRNTPPTAIPLSAATNTPLSVAPASGQGQPLPTTALALARPTPTPIQPNSSGVSRMLLFAIPAIVAAALFTAVLIIFRRQIRSQKKDAPKDGGTNATTDGTGTIKSGITDATTGGGSGTAQAGFQGPRPGDVPFNPGSTQAVRTEKTPPPGNLGQ